MGLTPTTKLSQGSVENPGHRDFKLSERRFSSDIPFKSCCMFPPFCESRWEGSHSLLHCPWNFNEYCFGLFQEKLLKSKQSVSQDTTERKNWVTQEKMLWIKFLKWKEKYRWGIFPYHFFHDSAPPAVLSLMSMTCHSYSIPMLGNCCPWSERWRKRKKKSRTEWGRHEGVQGGRDLLSVKVSKGGMETCSPRSWSSMVLLVFSGC